MDQRLGPCNFSCPSFVETLEVSVSQLTLKVSYCSKFTPPMLSNNTNLNLKKVLKTVLLELICVFWGRDLFWGLLLDSLTLHQATDLTKNQHKLCRCSWNGNHDFYSVVWMLNPLQTGLKLLHMQIKKEKSPVAVALTGYIRFFCCELHKCWR